MTMEQPASKDRVRSDEVRNRRLEKLRFWRRAWAEASQMVTPYNITSDSNPLFFFHGDYDTGGIYMRRLASLSNQPIMAIAPQGLHDGPIAASIEEMAKSRLDEIVSLRPRGPYRLGGYCNGALVAFETARTLRSRGEAIEIVILLEPSSLNARAPYRMAHRCVSAILDPGGKGSAETHNRIGAAMWQIWSLARVLKMSPSEIGALLGDMRARQTTRRQRLASQSGADNAERELQEKFAALKNAHYRASAAHIPQKVGFPVVAMSTGRDGAGRRSDLYDAVSWQAICSDFRHFRLPGHHSTCLSEGVDVLAGHLQALLAGTSQFPPARSGETSTAGAAQAIHSAGSHS